MQRSGSNKYADWFPLRNSARQASFCDPKTKQFTLIDTCYSTHHLQFDNDPDETVYFNELSGPIFGWIDSKVYDQTPGTPRRKRAKGRGLVRTGGRHQWRWEDHAWSRSRASACQRDPAAARGRRVASAMPPIRQAAGRRTRQRAGAHAVPFDPKLDTLVSFSLYAIIPSPVDDSVWGVVGEPFPGHA